MSTTAAWTKASTADGDDLAGPARDRAAATGHG